MGQHPVGAFHPSNASWGARANWNRGNTYFAGRNTNFARTPANRSWVRGNTTWNRSTAFRNGNWNGGNRNWSWRHHHDHFIFVGAFGFPWYDPFFYSDFYPYGYGYGYPYAYDPYMYYGQPVPYANNYDGPPPADDYQSGPYDQESRSDRSDRGNHSVVARVQERLAREGYYKGSIDGVTGPRTYYAIRSFERDHHLRVDGAISDQLLEELGVR